MTNPDTAGLRRLQIRPVRTLSGSGEEETVLTVWCPRQRATVEIDACATCGRCQGWVLDPTERESFLMCDPGVHLSKDVEAADDKSGPPVREIMSAGARVVKPDVSVETAISLMVEHGISGVPVVDDDGRPIGIVSKSDLVRLMQDRGDDEVVEHKARMQVGDVDVDLPPGYHVERLVKATVEDVMTPLAFSVHEGTRLARAAALMAWEGVHRVTVTSDDGRVTGVLSAMDVLKWVAREGGYTE
jgi:CBS domain-containing protein